MNYAHENSLFKTLYDAIPFDTYVVDVKNYEIIYMNRAMVEKIGDFTGETCYKSLFGENKPCIHCKISSLVDKDGRPNGKSYVFENFNPIDDRWYQLQEKGLGWPDGRTVKCSVAVDISELKETQNRLAEAHAELAIKNRELEVLSITDKLTRLNNRMKLDEALTMEMKRSGRYGVPLSVIITDVDHFKRVNDELGHQEGDLVLKAIADVLKKNIREVDIVGRWGGEEFMIICPETELKNAEQLAEKLRINIEQLELKSGVNITASFGVAGFSSKEIEKDLIQKADYALYRAKKKGRNRVERFCNKEQ